MPAADDVLVQWSAAGATHTAAAPGIIGNGRQWVYRVTGDSSAVQLSNLVLCLRNGAGTPSGFAVPVVQVPATAP